ncbi:MAG: hypothetical protein HY885_04440 [Deltaproteobacteria bacterium]|nr:hypothetical protein [Deltaproteobacteria bacterium]
MDSRLTACGNDGLGAALFGINANLLGSGCLKVLKILQVPKVVVLSDQIKPFTLSTLGILGTLSTQTGNKPESEIAA